MSMNNDIQLNASRVKTRERGTMTATSVGGLGPIGAIIYFFLTGQVPNSLVTSGRQPTGNQTSFIETYRTGEDASKSAEC